MADRVTVKLIGGARLREDLDRLDPSQNRTIIEPALNEGMLLALRHAARDHIHAGGKGPPLPKILTSRTGTLRRSIARSVTKVRRTSVSDFFIEGGSHLVYALVHEKGSDTHQARPFLGPGLRDAEPKLEGIVLRHWRKAVNQ